MGTHRENTVARRSLITTFGNLFLDKVVVAAILASLAPAFFCGLFIRRGQFVLGAAVGIAWVVLHGYLLFVLSQKRVVRWSISIPATTVGVAAIWMVLKATT